MKYLLFFCSVLCTFLLLQGGQPSDKDIDAVTQEKIERFSEFVGYTIGNEMRQTKTEIELKAFMQGVEKGKKGLPPGSVTQGDPMELIVQIQEALFEKKASENALLAEQFFKDLPSRPSMRAIIDKELYVEVVQEGCGKKTVDITSEPLVHYVARTLENIPIVNTYESGSPVRIPLLETISGFAKGMQGMQAGEKRRLYIHPNLAYKRGGSLPPNSVLLVEVEVLEIL